MAAIVWADVVAHAAELSTVNVTAQADLLAYVNTALAVGRYEGGEGGAMVRLSRIYLAAHLATINLQGGENLVVSESAGGLSRTYASPLSSSLLGSTPWGMSFLRLLPPSARGPQVI